MSGQTITKTLVDSLEKQAAEYTVWDAKLPGFGVRVRPTGPNHSSLFTGPAPAGRHRFGATRLPPSVSLRQRQPGPKPRSC
jgi:hypothetical protein